MIERNERESAVVALSCLMSSICLTVGVYESIGYHKFKYNPDDLENTRETESVVFPQHLISSMCLCAFRGNG